MEESTTTEARAIKQLKMTGIYIYIFTLNQSP